MTDTAASAPDIVAQRSRLRDTINAAKPMEYFTAIDPAVDVAKRVLFPNMEDRQYKLLLSKSLATVERKTTRKMFGCPQGVAAAITACNEPTYYLGNNSAPKCCTGTAIACCLLSFCAGKCWIPLCCGSVCKYSAYSMGGSAVCCKGARLYSHDEHAKLYKSLVAEGDRKSECLFCMALLEKNLTPRTEQKLFQIAAIRQVFVSRIKQILWQKLPQQAEELTLAFMDFVRDDFRYLGMIKPPFPGNAVLREGLTILSENPRELITRERVELNTFLIERITSRYRTAPPPLLSMKRDDEERVPPAEEEPPPDQAPSSTATKPSRGGLFSRWKKKKT